MAVTEEPKTFVSHGKSFLTAKEAHRHDQLYQSREELENAQRKFQRLLAENATTKDGHPFEFGVFNDYWQLVRPWSSFPHLRKFTYLCWSWSVREQIDRPEVVEIREEQSLSKEQMHWVPISELFRSEKAARAALMADCKKWLEEKAAELEEMAEREAKRND